jgi:IclR family acetate operon transcriptional repressor
MSLTTIAARLNLAPSTTHRLLTTLEQERYVRFDAEKRAWSIGVQTFVAGRAFLTSRDLVGVAHPFMRRVMDEAKATVNLAVQDQSEAAYVHQVRHPSLTRTVVKTGGRVALYCSAVGKALLAGRADRELEDLLPRGEARRITAKTIVSRSALRDDIELTRQRGFAVDDEEHEIGLRCVAALVYNEVSEPIAAVSVSGPSTHFSHSDFPRFGRLLRQKAAEITAGLGGLAPVDSRWAQR